MEASKGVFVDLGQGRSQLHWRIRRDQKVELEVVLQNQAATFVCDIHTFLSVCEGKSLQITLPHGTLLARGSQNGVWFIYEIPEWRYQDSCLVPHDHLEQVLRNSGGFPHAGATIF